MTKTEKITISISIVSIIIAGVSCWFSIKAESRADRLFQAQRVSEIQVTPVKFETYRYNTGTLMGRLVVEVGNYTGFTAYDIDIDAKWDGAWINEWIYVAQRGLAQEKERRSLTQDEQYQLKAYTKNVESKQFCPLCFYISGQFFF